MSEPTSTLTSKRPVDPVICLKYFSGTLSIVAISSNVQLNFFFKAGFNLS